MEKKKANIIFYLKNALVISFYIALFICTLYSHWLTGVNPLKGMMNFFVVTVIVGITWIVGFVLLLMRLIANNKISFLMFFFLLVLLPIGIFGNTIFHLRDAGRRHVLQNIGLDILQEDGLTLLRNYPQRQMENRKKTYIMIKKQNWPQSIKNLNPMSVYINDNYIGIVRMSRSWQEEIRIYEVLPNKVDGQKLSDRIYLLLN